MEENLTLAEVAEKVRESNAAVLVAQTAMGKAQREARERETALVIVKSNRERWERRLIETALTETV